MLYSFRPFDISVMSLENIFHSSGYINAAISKISKSCRIYKLKFKGCCLIISRVVGEKADHFTIFAHFITIFVLFQDQNQHGSDDLYNFHEAVSLLIETEEQVIDEHRSSMEVRCYASKEFYYFI